MADDDTYKVGYGKPPRKHQFKKGTTGNAKGRPKGAKNLKTVFREEMDEKILVNTATGQKKISTLHALLMRLKEKALKGDLKALIKILEYELRLNPENTAPEPDPNAPRTGVLVLEPRCKTEEEFEARFKDVTYTPVKDMNL